MMMLTCALSQGLWRTGMSEVICGFISPRCATSSMKAVARAPKARTLVLPTSRVPQVRQKDTKSIVS